MQIEAGLYDEAIKSAQWVLQQDPDFPFVDAQLGRALILSGRPDDALPIFSRKPEHSVFLGYLYAVTGRRDEAEALAAGFLPAHQFWIYAGLGDKDRAFEALDRAVTINPRLVAGCHLDEPAGDEDPARRSAVSGDPAAARSAGPNSVSLPVEPETHTRDARRDDDERLQEGRGLPTQVLLRVRVEGVEDVDEAR